MALDMSNLQINDIVSALQGAGGGQQQPQYQPVVHGQAPASRMPQIDPKMIMALMKMYGGGMPGGNQVPMASPMASPNAAGLFNPAMLNPSGIPGG